MRRLPVVGWSFLVSIWAGLVGGVVIYLPSVEYIQMYTLGFQLVAWAGTYWTIRTHQSIFEDAHRPGRVPLFILAFFFPTAMLATLANLVVGHTTPLGILVQFVAFGIGLTVALYVTFAGGFEWAWDRYT